MRRTTTKATQVVVDRFANAEPFLLVRTTDTRCRFFQNEANEK